MKPKIAIVGYGYVGRALHCLFEDWVCAIFDPNPTDEAREEAKSLGYEAPFGSDWGTNEVFDKVNECELAIVSVPTLEKEDGSCDVSIVKKTIERLETKLILIKSTIRPGTTDKLMKETGKKLVFSPEYIGEGGYFTPPWLYPDPKLMKKHTFQIFGGPRKQTNGMVDMFIRKVGPHVFFAQTDAKTAEVVKYMENSWGAMKVIFGNEWFDICETQGVDYREVRELWALDSRVEKMHTAVFPHSRGYGGKCFPKDVAAIVQDTNEKGYVPEMMETVIKRNKYFNSLNKKS